MNNSTMFYRRIRGSIRAFEGKRWRFLNAAEHNEAVDKEDEKREKKSKVFYRINGAKLRNDQPSISESISNV